MAKKTVNFGIIVVTAIGLWLTAASPSGATQPPPAPCLYGFEWLHTFRFPFQADPHAAYSYVVVPQLPASDVPVGFLVDAEFPYAAWFSWTIYGQRLLAVALASDHKIVPDAGSTNPYEIGAPVFAPSRHYRLLLLPPETPSGLTLAPALADIPVQNRLTIPMADSATVIAYRVYQAFPGYNLGGSGGQTNTPFPSVYAVNYETGEKLDCPPYDVVPASIGHLPTDTPDVFNLYGAGGVDPSPGVDVRALAEGTRLQARVPALAALQSKVGWQYAPEIDPDLVTFTRPPRAPGADVSSVPPPDNCAGYLGARVDPHRIALIRLPHVASYFETAALEPDATFPDPEAAYISLTMYGAAVNTYEPGDSESASIADAEFKLDETGGCTILIWPRHLSTNERSRLFDYALERKWVLMRGGRTGPLTTANMLLRLKRANDDYYGAYTPLTGGRSGVQCYFEEAAPGARWSEIENAPDPMEFVASFVNLGNAAPQGVHCGSVAEVLNGSCQRRLEEYIEKTGGKYFNPGYVPPP